MADPVNTEAEEVIDDVEEQVETPNGEDEDQDDEENIEEAEADDQEQEESEEEESESEEDEDKPEPEEESKFTKRFTQIKGDTPEEYAVNLEEAYRNSSTEGQRNAKELKDAKAELDKIGAVIANNPELAKQLNDALDGTPAPKQKEDPAIVYAREEMKKKLDGEYNAFTEVHPEMVTDEALREEVLTELGILADVYAAKGKTLGMEEGLKKAWISLGHDAADAAEEKITKAKGIAATPATPGKAKKARTSNGLTDDQIALAKRYGLTPEQLAANK